MTIISIIPMTYEQRIEGDKLNCTPIVIGPMPTITCPACKADVTNFPWFWGDLEGNTVACGNCLPKADDDDYENYEDWDDDYES